MKLADMAAETRDSQTACENQEPDLIHRSDKSESHAISFGTRPAYFHLIIKTLQHESEFYSGKFAAIIRYRSRKLSRHYMEDDGTAAKNDYCHKHMIIAMHSRTWMCSPSGRPRGEVAGCAYTGKARPRGLLPTSWRLRLSSSPTPTSTPPRQHAAKTRLHIV